MVIVSPKGVKQARYSRQQQIEKKPGICVDARLHEDASRDCHLRTTLDFGCEITPLVVQVHSRHYSGLSTHQADSMSQQTHKLRTEDHSVDFDVASDIWTIVKVKVDASRT